MIYVQVADGMVVNRALFDTPMPDDWPDRASWIESDTAQIGWAYADGVFTEPPLPPSNAPAMTPPPQTAVLFDHENRLRSVEGVPPLTLDDFIAKAHAQ